MSSEFDIVFAGGGATACTVAGRLIAANPSLRVLVVERGQHSCDAPIHVQPCRFVENIAPASTTTSSHIAKQTGHLNGRAVTIPSGKSVGGGSGTKIMVYVRGAASDYDDWAKFGNEGWSFAELLPLAKKAETFAPKAGLPTHGYTGPIQVSFGEVDLGVGKQLLNVGEVYEPHRPQADDINDFETANAYSPWYKFIDPQTGRRSDAASGYLYPQLQNANLEIRVGKCVKRVIIENGRAVGIEYTPDATSSPGARSELVTVMASKLVVVSAGAFGSPAILERSGIGATSILNKNNVPIIVDLPGVGENYQDHFGTFPVFYASYNTDTMDDVWRGPEQISARLNEQETNGTGEIAQNSGEAMIKIRPTTTELASIGPTFQSRWDRFFRNSPDKPIAIVGVITGYLGDHAMLPPSSRKFLTIGYYLLYPQSVGSIHITSGEDVKAPSNFDPRFLTEAGDVACLSMLYKKARELVRRMPAYRGEGAFCQPLFAADSPAACRESDGPVPISAPDIVYSAEDDKAIEEFHRNFGQTTWHSLGTCSMKPREQGGVVDSRLNVYGVQNLKVADVSICPSNVGNNTYSTALLVGEKAAVIIAQDLGLNIA